MHKEQHGRSSPQTAWQKHDPRSVSGAQHPNGRTTVLLLLRRRLGDLLDAETYENDFNKDPEGIKTEDAPGGSECFSFSAFSGSSRESV
jgi:hypothetical protein